MSDGPKYDGPLTARVEAAAYRGAMARLAGAVHVITTDGPGGRTGFTASAVCSVSDAPPTLLVCMNRGFSGYEAFGRNGVLCVNTLAAEHRDVAAAFGGKTPMAERFTQARWREDVPVPALAGALAAFVCRIANRSTVGTHDVLFCEVLALAEPAEADALVYADRRYHALAHDPSGQEPARGRAPETHGLESIRR